MDSFPFAFRKGEHYRVVKADFREQNLLNNGSNHFAPFLPLRILRICPTFPKWPTVAVKIACVWPLDKYFLPCAHLCGRANGQILAEQALSTHLPGVARLGPAFKRTRHSCVMAGAVRQIRTSLSQSLGQGDARGQPRHRARRLNGAGCGRLDV
jgi:hypothetical protein